MSKQDHNLSPEELEQRLKEKKWETVQIKGLSAWMNTYLAKANLEPIRALPDDITDGVRLLQFLELLTEKSAGPFKKDPTNRIQKIENCSKAIKFISNDLQIRLVGIGAEDLADGNLMLVLGLLWSSFRKLSLGSIGDSLKGDTEGNKTGGARKGKPEDDLLKWIGELTQDYDVPVASFKESFNNGMAWAALVDRFDPDFLDFRAVSQMGAEERLNLIFDVAEKKLGIPKLLEVSDLISGNPDERSVVLYSSLFYHSWTSNQERIKLANEKRGKENTMSDMKAKLAMEEEERQRLQRETAQLNEIRGQKDKELEETESKVKSLEDLLVDLEEQKNQLHAQILAEKEAASARAKEEQEMLKAQIAKTSDNIQKELKARLQEEEARKNQRGQENLELLASKQALVEALQEGGLGWLPQGPSALLKTSILGSTPSLTRFNAQLREHVNALHLRLKEMQDQEEEEAEKKNIEEDRRSLAEQVQSVVNETVDKDMSEAIQTLSKQFKGTNQTMLRILSVKDAVNELRETVDKRGYLMAQVEGKRWKKRWFVLRGFVLYYYNKKEEQDDIAGAEGEVSLENAVVTAHDEEESKPTWTIKIAVSVDENGDHSEREELIVGAKTMEERNDWFTLMQGKVLYLQYLALCRNEQLRPDPRIIALCGSMNISVLNLDELRLSTNLVEILGTLIESHREVERVSLSGADLDDEKVALVAKFLTSTPGLVSLNLSNNKITSKGVSSLAKALSTHKRIKVLNLSKNQIDDEGFQRLAAVFQSNADLEQVALARNKISGASGSFTEAAQAFSALGKLSRLSLNSNQLGDEAAAELAKVFQDHPSLVTVKLQSNKIGTAGAAAIFDALQTNNSVTQVNLGFNKIGNDALSNLKQLFIENQVIRSVELSGNRGITGGPQLKALAEVHDLDIPQFSAYKL